MNAVATVEVDVGARAYPVLVGDGAIEQLARLVADRVPNAKRAAIVAQAAMQPDVDSGLAQFTCVIGDGEHVKALSTVEELCREFAQRGLSRADVVIAVGGGVVTDVGGFAAAAYHRGVAVIHVATTLLGQIDAAIGGKTGVNLPEGKNLIGAFHQPAAVICDTAMLATLPQREMRSGMGELAKYHFLGGDTLDEMPLPEQVAECVRLKAAVVAADETEAHSRALLNYGHTLAHALEVAGEFDLRHGEAVAIGLRFAALVSHELERIDAARVAEHERVLARYELPNVIPQSVRCTDDELIDLMRRDKKSTSGALTFVLDGPDGLEIVADVAERVVRAALARARQPVG